MQFLALIFISLLAPFHSPSKSGGGTSLAMATPINETLMPSPSPTLEPTMQTDDFTLLTNYPNIALGEDLDYYVGESFLVKILPSYISSSVYNIDFKKLPNGMTLYQEGESNPIPIVAGTLPQKEGVYSIPAIYNTSQGLVGYPRHVKAFPLDAYDLHHQENYEETGKYRPYVSFMIDGWGIALNVFRFLVHIAIYGYFSFFTFDYFYTWD